MAPTHIIIYVIYQPRRTDILNGVDLSVNKWHTGLLIIQETVCISRTVENHKVVGKNEHKITNGDGETFVNEARKSMLSMLF